MTGNSGVKSWKQRRSSRDMLHDDDDDDDDKVIPIPRATFPHPTPNTAKIS